MVKEGNINWKGLEKYRQKYFSQQNNRKVFVTAIVGDMDCCHYNAHIQQSVLFIEGTERDYLHMLGNNNDTGIKLYGTGV